jgi:magnesium and cobalt transporter
MSDTDDGVADGQTGEESRRGSPRGLLGRIIDVLSPSEAAEREARQRAPGVGSLRRLRVEDVMLPKAEIVSVPVSIGRDDLVKVFSSSGLTRLPVYKGTLDQPVGLIHLKDFALTHGFGGKPGGRFSLRPLLRPILYVPPSMPLSVLLQKMQAERSHMALVIDEYGGVDGLVTIEDLIEQVVGEIEDEHDVAESATFVKEKDGVYLAKATTDLAEFEAEVGLRLATESDADDIDTLGGLVFMLAGHVPARGQIIRHPDGHEFEVVEADPRRIKRLRVRLNLAGDG